MAGSAASLYPCRKGRVRKEGGVMAHVIVRIIELVMLNALAATLTAMFVLAVITVVHGLHAAGRPR